MPNEFPEKQPKRQFAFPKHVQSKTSIISKQLMRTCIESKVTSTNAYEIFNVLYSLTQELIELQKSKSFVDTRSFADFSFRRKLEKQTENRLDLVNGLISEHSQFVRQKVVTQSFAKNGLGLAAVSRIEEGTCVLRISKDVMLDVSTGSSPEFRQCLVLSNACFVSGSFISQDPIASSMENVALSLRLLTELVLWSKSNYYNYIRSLPISYQTFMDMNPDDLKHLRGSTVLETLVWNFLFICRQYAYFFNRFQDKTGLQIARSFGFEDYRWAVSSVMSRNNLIPKGDKDAKQMCMIPIWDMINHKTGRVTTDFNPESGELIFYAMESTKPGDQIFMDYGARTSAEFLLFSGFVPAHNPHNHVRVTFGISNADPLGSKRRRILELIGLEIPLVCHITDKTISLVDVLAFARIFVMNEEELDSLLSSDQSVHDDLRSFGPGLKRTVDHKATDFLVKRFQLLIMAYGPVITVMDSEHANLTPIQQHCELLRTQEIELLRASIVHLETIRSSSDKPETLSTPDLTGIASVHL
ncbi:hypothetical protein EG68_04838 [Paragonimus skrjabini miyazakii]|uniref:protein-histidine N-methyltransferase n=1 Tax=Paragonimus skrjabini miyazakii TaxID=59628 RepID=A0A8S9YAI7_9TREM|nr:hypothetical protein EG68_04838 [Paragonimus skrjabini miyazakii]